MWQADMADNWFDEVLRGLADLNQAIEDIRQSIVAESGVSYTSQDARHVALDGLQCDIGACGNWMRALRSLKELCQEKYGSHWDDEYRHLIGTGWATGLVEDLMIDYLRNTLVTKIHFKVENLFINILRTLSASPAKSSFWNIKNAMLVQAAIRRDGPEDNALMVLAKIRNSYHGNGMCDKYPLSCVIGGLQFEFSPGRPVECASWAHIIAVLKGTVAALEAIILSKQVSGLKGEITDPFASRVSPATGSGGN